MRRLRQAFTLVEVLIALTLLGLLTAMLFTSFNAIVRAWESGRTAIDATNHADYLLEQLSAALRSAYFPGSGEKYGLIFTDDGDDPRSHDLIEWTKVGAALVGEDADFANVPHRVRVTVTEPDAPFPGGFTVRAWRQDLQLDAFDPDRDTIELSLSPKVIGLNCRLLDPDSARTADDELNWIDEWTKTNTLPTALELTLWMEPAEKDAEPIEAKRIIELPMGALSQNPSLASSANETSKRGTSTSVGGGRRPNRPGAGNAASGGQDLFRPGNGNGQPPGGTPPTPGGGNTRPGSRPGRPNIEDTGNGLFRPGR
ncbi:MAG: prepilin-type N-terminal cleavage/methylation domain-containing protein [Lentisphaeraceae bacterium]|nr:prepilin-type N-terminal cleavage/methylation domain-containing protein [Lentisphaeraceae bacterium]